MTVLEGYRVSPQQAALLASASSPDDRSRRTTATIQIDGPVDRTRLETALLQLWNRWDVLRTECRGADRGQAVQAIASPLNSFPLDSGAQGVEWSDGFLRFDFPAAVVDLRSLPAMLAELATLYDDPRSDDQAERVQYLQYAEYVNDWRGSEEHDELRRRWTARDHCDASPRMWEDARPSAGPDPSTVECALTSDPWERAVALGVSEDALLYATWQAVLARWSGDRRFRLDCEISGRSFDELKRVPGPFSAWLPDLVDARSETPFRSLAQRCHESLQELEELFEGRPEASPAAMSEPTVGFVVQDFSEVIERSGLRWRLARAERRSADLETLLRVHRYPEGCEVAIEFDRSTVDQATAASLADAFGAAWESAMDQPDRPIGDLRLLSETRRRRILGQFTPSKRGAASPEPVPARFERQARNQPAAVAVRDNEVELTYGELNARSNRLARLLRTKRVGPGSVVAVYGDRSAAAVAAVMAVLKTGAAFLPLDPAQPSLRLAAIVQEANARIVLADRETQDAWVNPLDEFILLPEIDDLLSSQASDDLDLPIADASLAYLLYTSGSTGAPKGVAVEHRALGGYLDWVEAAYSNGQGGAPLHSSLGFDLTLTSLLGPLCAGTAVHVVAADDPVEALSSTLETRGGFDWIKMTPGHAQILGMRLDPERLRASTAQLILGGEALRPERFAAWSEAAPDLEIVNEYGPTEAVVGCCVHRFRASDAQESRLIGRPIDGARLYLCDPRGGLVPSGATGEILIGGSWLARGYAGRPAETAARFLPDPYSQSPGARLYRTGDSARQDDRGVFEYVGRIDDQIKLRGYRIEPGEIEAALKAFPSVDEAAVVLAGARGEPRLVGYFIASSAPPSFSELRAFLAERLPEYMLPASLVQLPALPLTSNGKTDRDVLRKRPLESDPGMTGPVTLEEETLTQIWAKVLGVDGFGVEDDYFALGGDSIRAIEIVGQAEQRGLKISLDDVFRFRTIRALARAAASVDGVPARLAPTPFSLTPAQDRDALPPEVEDAYPLSALQAGMIFHREYHAESAIYHDIFGYRLRMPLDVEKLRAAAAALVERHPTLRTAFALRGHSEPLQWVLPTAPNPLSVTDLRGLDEEAQETAIDQWMEAEKRRGFDYLKPPLLRFQIHIRSDQDFQFSLSFHHAILDGWSDASMLVQLAVSYQHLLDGKEIPFHSPKTLYREFIALERQALESAECRDYWQNKLDDAAPLVLPRGSTEPEAAARGVKLQVVPLPAEVSTALAAVARKLAVPLKSVLLAAHLRVLAELGGTRDVLSSLSSAGRPETLDANETLGLHLNSTPIRLQLPRASWSELALAAFEQEREALPYRRFPLAEIQRLARHRRLTETSFYYTHYHNVRQLRQLPQFEILGRKVYEETSFTLVANFNLDPFDQTIALTLACDQTQLDAAQRRRVGDYYERALRSLAEDPEARHDEAELASADEISGLLSHVGTPLASPVETPLRLFERWAKQTPDAPAASSGRQSLSYAELDRLAESAAARLAAAGVRAGDRVALLMERSAALPAAILAVLKLGAAYVPMEPSHPQQRLADIVEDAAPTALILGPGLEDLAARLSDKPAIVLDVSEETHAADQRAPESDPDADLPAYVLYTSGSTGKPKGVVVPRSCLAASTAARFARYDASPRAYLLLSSYAFDSSVAGIFWTLASGGELVIPNADEYRDPDAVVRLLEERNVSHLLAVPSLYREILQAAEGVELPRFQVAIVAGESCPSDLVRGHFETLPDARLYNEYGPTEGTVWCTVHECSPDEGDAPLIGRAIPGARTYVMGPDLRLAPGGVRGELCLTGPGVASGYLDRPGATAAAFLPNPLADQPGERLYRTGDAVRLQSDGALEFLGRADQQVKVRGHRVELGDVEAALLKLAELREAVVVPVESASGSVRLAAFVTAGPSDSADSESIRRALTAVLPEAFVPAQIQVVDRLPRTANGKTDRRKLAAEALAGASSSAGYLAPRNAAEETLAAIWSETLGVDRVGVEDDFFALGGDSILSIRIIARARDAGLTVTPLDLFERRTIAALAEVADAAEPQSVAAAAGASPVQTSGVSQADLDAVLGGEDVD